MTFATLGSLSRNKLEMITESEVCELIDTGKVYVFSHGNKTAIMHCKENKVYLQEGSFYYKVHRKEFLKEIREESMK